ncbi:MAG: NUDIX domain-containing protein [Acidimicrobiia bacterium]
MAPEKNPEIQLISNLVVTGPDGRVLFVRYDPEDDRWWLPGEDLEPYEHPDERAHIELERLGLAPDQVQMMFVESFRGRRGWHVVFHYRVETASEPSGKIQAEWFPLDGLPRTMHGRWELDAVRRVLGQDKASS